MSVRGRSRGLARTKPSWMSDKQFSEVIGARRVEEMEAQAREQELANLMFEATGDDGTVVPVQAPILSRTLVLRNAFNPKRLQRNPYLDGAGEGEDEEAPKKRIFPDIEREYTAKCAQFGFVRYTSASATSDGGCEVRVGFATKEGAKLCIDAFHGKPMPWGVAMVADYDVSGSHAGDVKASRAIWIGNVFDPSVCFLASAANAASESVDVSGGGRAVPTYLEQLESDFWGECSRFGPLVSVVSNPAEGAVHAVFRSIVSAGDCIHAMHGR
mmetsp:Transcript_37795/g.84442  ORF Transcript_37795/g.84442 Transcript_37795/m.84442 type:complete len:271 (-) Transcript_37795:1114-1926(-)